MHEKSMHAVSKITVVALLWSIVLVNGAVANAASTTSMSDTMSRLKISTLSNHDIRFVTPTGADASTDTITLTFAAGFTMGSFSVNNVDLAVSASAACTAFPTEKTLAASAGAGTWGVAQAGQVITLTAPTDAAGGEVAAGRCIQIEVGSNATAGAAGATQITNPGSAGSTTVAVAGTFGDTGSMAVGITNDDRVSVTATIDPSITFDIDSGTTQGSDNNGPHTVALGTLSTGTLTTSDQSAINSIFIDLSTNASAGATVTVLGANGGLTSAVASKTIDISGAESTIAAGTEGFGLCVESVTQTAGGTLAAGTQYDSGASASNCTAANGGTPTVGSVETTATQILNTSSATISGGRAEILVKAAIAGTTPAANDYTETLTFIATGTF